MKKNLSHQVCTIHAWTIDIFCFPYSPSNGDEETGITILDTVSKMDAGPIALQRSLPLLGNETSGELLDLLFTWGGKLLVDEVLPQVFSGALTQETAQEQDESLVTKASLISKEEGRLFPHNESSVTMRDKIRGFATWPGATLPLACSGSAAPLQGFRAQVFGVDIVPASSVLSVEDAERSVQDLLYIEGKDGSPGSVGIRSAVDSDNVLLLSSLHLPGKKKVPASTFYKGYMTTQPAHWMGPEEELALAPKNAGGNKARRKKVRH